MRCCWAVQGAALDKYEALIANDEPCTLEVSLAAGSHGKRFLLDLRWV